MHGKLRGLLGAWALWLSIGGASAEGLLWEIHGEDDALLGHLFGTVHLCSAECYPLPAPVLGALSGDQRVALELDPEDPELGSAVVLAGLLPDGRRLDSMLPEGQRDSLDKAIGLSGLDEQAVMGMQPWLASSVLLVSAAERAGYQTHWGIDLWLAREARRGGRAVLALETVERQIQAMAAGGEEAQLASLAQILKLVTTDGVGSFLEKLRRAWQAGDAETLLAMIEDDAGDARLRPMLDELVEARNREMAHRIAELLRDGPQLFVAIGAAHLAGPRSVVARLEELGFQVRPAPH